MFNNKGSIICYKLGFRVEAKVSPKPKGEKRGEERKKEKGKTRETLERGPAHTGKGHRGAQERRCRSFPGGGGRTG